MNELQQLKQGVAAAYKELAAAIDKIGDACAALIDELNSTGSTSDEHEDAMNAVREAMAAWRKARSDADHSKQQYQATARYADAAHVADWDAKG